MAVQSEGQERGLLDSPDAMNLRCNRTWWSVSETGTSSTVMTKLGSKQKRFPRPCGKASQSQGEMPGGVVVVVVGSSGLAGIT